MTVLIFAADDQAGIFALFQHVVALEDEALLVCLDEDETSGNAGADFAVMTTIKSRYINLGAMLRATPLVYRGGASIPGVLSPAVLPYFGHSAQK